MTEEKLVERVTAVYSNLNTILTMRPMRRARLAAWTCQKQRGNSLGSRRNTMREQL